MGTGHWEKQRRGYWGAAKEETKVEGKGGMGGAGAVELGMKGQDDWEG